MSSQEFLELLEQYEKKFSGILSRFSRRRDGVPDMASSDESGYRQDLQEIIDLIDDGLGNNRYSSTIAELANDGVAYTGTPSQKSVEDILSVVRALLTRVRRSPELVDGARKKASANLEAIWPLLHPTVVAIGKSRFDAGHYADSVEAVLKELNSVVKMLHKAATGEELDGVPLMRKAFTPSKPTIVLDDLSTETGRNIQQGHMDLAAGSMSGVRNPKAHGNVTITPERAIHHLFLASLLFFKLDERPP